MEALKLEYLPHYTYEDYVAWEGRWEIIEGIPYAMSPAPMKKHQFISSNIGWQLKNLLKDCKRCKALLPVDWKIAEDTIVQPDNLVVCDEDLEGAYITKAPLLIFEILSKSTAIKDVNIKFKIYEQEGVPYYCIVNPNEKIAKLYKLKDGKYIKEGDFIDKSYKFLLEDCEMDFDFGKVW